MSEHIGHLLILNKHLSSTLIVNIVTRVCDTLVQVDTPETGDIIGETSGLDDPGDNAEVNVYMQLGGVHHNMFHFYFVSLEGGSDEQD